MDFSFALNFVLIILSVKNSESRWNLKCVSASIENKVQV